MYMRILRIRFSNHTAGVVAWVSLKLGKSYEVTSLSAVHASEQNDIIYGVRCHINFYLCCMFSHFSQSDYAARVRQLAQPARNVNSIGSRIASRHSVSTAIAIRRQRWFKRSLSLLEYYCKRDNFFYLLLRFYKHSGRSATAFADRVGVAPFWVTLSICPTGQRVKSRPMLRACR